MFQQLACVILEHVGIAKVVVDGRSPQSVGDAQSSARMVSRSPPHVTKSAELDCLFQQVREKCGRIDVLYANARIVKLRSVAEMTEEVFDDILDANFRDAYSQSRRHCRS